MKSYQFLPFSKIQDYEQLLAQIREQMTVPVESEAYKKKTKTWKKKNSQKKKINFILCNFSVLTLQCKKKNLFFCPWKIEKTAQKSCS